MVGTLSLVHYPLYIKNSCGKGIEHEIYMCLIISMNLFVRQGPTKAAPSHRLPRSLLPFLSTMYAIAIHTGIPGIIQIDLKIFPHVCLFEDFPCVWNASSYSYTRILSFLQDIPQSHYKKLSPAQGVSGATLCQLAKANCYTCRKV